MGVHIWAQELVTQTFWQSEVLDVQPHFIPFLELHLLSKLATKSLYHLCAFSKLAFATSHKRDLSSSSYVTIGTSSLASLGGCPCVAQVMGTIGELPVTI
jgi:hypothetical protein